MGLTAPRFAKPALALMAFALVTGAAAAQELGTPPEGLVIRWRAPEVPQMPTVTWTAVGVEGAITTMRSETRVLFDRMSSDSTMYRVLFPLRSTDPFGTVSEFEYDRAAIDGIGRLDPGKTFRFGMTLVTTVTHPQTRQRSRQESAGATLVTVERHETIQIPAGRFDTVVVTLEYEGPRPSPVIHRTVRRYWYAPAIGWYVQHELIATGPQLNQRNFYVASSITLPQKRTDRR